MASNRTLPGLGHLLRVLHSRAEGSSDGQLLERFHGQRDEAAFTTLVQRHGPMVLGVCRRILDNTADAEDAFQATFLVLARRAGSLLGSATLGGFLHGVARRTALKARDARIRRRLKEQVMARPEAQGEAVRDDFLPLLDEELEGLPEKYRLPLVLCELEGRTRQEAAAQLGWPEGTVAGRLARAREMLARRLARHGRPVSAGALGAMLTQQAGPVALPPALVEVTVRAASLLAAAPAVAGAISAQVLGLTEGVVQAMAMSKFQAAVVTTVLLVLGTTALGIGTLAGRQPSGKGDGVEIPAVRADVPPKEPERAREEPASKEAPAPPPEAEYTAELSPQSFQLADTLAKVFDFTGYEDPRITLGEITEHLEKRYGVSIEINRKAFENDGLVDVARFEPVAREPIPVRKSTLRQQLNLILERLPARSNAMYVLRDNSIELTTLAAVRAELGRGPNDPVLPLVHLPIEKQPLENALRLLAKHTGKTLVLDQRAGDKAKAIVAATFKNVPLDSAVRVLADMADLKPVQIDNMIYITSPENADRLEKEQSKRKAAP